MGRGSLKDNKRSISVLITPFFSEKSSISLLRPISDFLSPTSWESPKAEMIASEDRSENFLSRFLATK
jgi:hypothetical protein